MAACPQASRLPIKDIVLGTVEEKHIPRPLIVGIGIVLFIVSALLPHFASGTMLYLAGGFSLLGLIAATILVIPIFTNIASAGLERFYGAVAGNEGRIAARNMKDNKNVTQNITLLFISISAIIAIRVVGNFCDNLYQRRISWRRASRFCRRTYEAGICGTGKRDGRFIPGCGFYLF